MFLPHLETEWQWGGAGFVASDYISSIDKLISRLTFEDVVWQAPELVSVMSLGFYLIKTLPLFFSGRPHMVLFCLFICINCILSGGA